METLQIVNSKEISTVSINYRIRCSFRVVTKFYLIALLSIFTFTSTLYSQNIRMLKKENKELMKELKKEYNLNYISIQVGDNGFWYFLGSKNVNNKKCYGVISKDRKVIFDFKYESIVYINEISKEGYTEYTFPSMIGGTDKFLLYNHKMPGHFLLDEAERVKICTIDGETICSDIKNDEIYYVGSWLIINAKKIYTRQLNGFKRLMLVNNETKNMGLMTWDGKEIFKTENFLIYITSKEASTYNNAYTFNNNNKMGAIYMEDLNSLVPTEYLEISASYTDKSFMVKLNPSDKLHKYNPGINEKFVPKNAGEQFYIDHKYEECIKYYSEAGVKDPDSKLFSASALYSIALTRIINLINHVQAPEVNKLKDYNYDEIKKLLEDSKTILQTSIIQDSVRSDRYLNIINNCDKSLNDLYTYNEQLKENSFANKLVNAILMGISEGLKQAALNSVNNLINNRQTITSTKVQSTVIPSSNQVTSKEPSNSNKSNRVSEPVNRKEKCRACNGMGFWVDERISGDLKWCDRCGKSRKPHAHKTCGSCKGTGWK